MTTDDSFTDGSSYNRGTADFLADHLRGAVAEVLDAKLTMVETRLQTKLSRIQARQLEEAAGTESLQLSQLSCRITAVEARLESLAGKTVDTSEDDSGASPHTMSIGDSKDSRTLPESATLCKQTISQLQTALKTELEEFCGTMMAGRLNALENRMARVEEGKRSASSKAHEAASSAGQQKGPSVRQGVVVVLQAFGVHLKCDNQGWLLRPDRSNPAHTALTDVLVILYICHHDGTFIIRHLHTGKLLQRHGDGRLCFGDSNENPQKFYITKAHSEGAVSLRCKGINSVCCIQRGGLTFRTIPLQEGDLGILTMEESGFVPREMSDSCAGIPVGVEIALRGTHGSNLQQDQGGKAVCVIGSRIRCWERFVIWRADDAFVLISTKDGTFLAAFGSELVFQKDCEKPHLLDIESFPRGNLRFIFRKTGNVVRTYSNHQVRCEDSTGGAWSKWTIVWRSDGLL